MNKWREGRLGVLIDIAALAVGIATVVYAIRGYVFLLAIGVPLALDGAWSLYRKARGRAPYENAERAGAIGALYFVGAALVGNLLALSAF